MPSKSAFIIEGCFFEKNFRENEVFFQKWVFRSPSVPTFIYGRRILRRTQKEKNSERESEIGGIRIGQYQR